MTVTVVQGCGAAKVAETRARRAEVAVKDFIVDWKVSEDRLKKGGGGNSKEKK